MKQVYKIDENGFYIKPIIVENDTPSDCVETQCPNGFYRPRWTESEWVEGLTQEEINVIKNQPQPKSEEEKLRIRINALEDALMELI